MDILFFNPGPCKGIGRIRISVDGKVGMSIGHAHHVALSVICDVIDEHPCPEIYGKYLLCNFAIFLDRKSSLGVIADGASMGVQHVVLAALILLKLEIDAI